MDRIIVLRETKLDPRFPLSRRELTALGETVLGALNLGEGSVTVKLVDDREIARLNRDFMRCDGPTNVLSFPSEGDDADDLGELALSVDALAREAELYGQEPYAHLVRLLAHGMLHLAGYDHGPEMFDLTDRAVDVATLERDG